LLGEGKIVSYVGSEGYMIEGTKGTLKEGDINPLTKDKIVNRYGHFCSYSIAKEIEVWLIKFTK
jgi:hypothetical protein